MTAEEQKNLKTAIIAASAYYGRQLTDDAIRMYVADLADIPYSDVMIAMKKYRLNTANRQMFLPAHLREIVYPTLNPKDLARVTATKIIEAIGKFGWSNPEGAKAHIGDAGWVQVQRAGGWQYICENMGVSIQTTTFLAQARDAIESEISLQRLGVDTTLPVIEQAEERKLLEQNQNRIGAVVKQLSDKLSLKEGKNGQANNSIATHDTASVRDCEKTDR